MKQVTMMYLKSCPYCKQAFTWMKELEQEYPAYQQVEMKLIEEREQSEVADAMDYWYVPCYFIDGEKVHEGAATKERIKAVFEAALR